MSICDEKYQFCENAIIHITVTFWGGLPASVVVFIAEKCVCLVWRQQEATIK